MNKTIKRKMNLYKTVGWTVGIVILFLVTAICIGGYVIAALLVFGGITGVSSLFGQIVIGAFGFPILFLICVFLITVWIDAKDDITLSVKEWVKEKEELIKRGAAIK